MSDGLKKLLGIGSDDPKDNCEHEYEPIKTGGKNYDAQRVEHYGEMDKDTLVVKELQPYNEECVHCGNRIPGFTLPKVTRVWDVPFEDVEEHQNHERGSDDAE